MIIYEPFRSLPLSKFRDELLFEYPDLPTQLFDYYLLRAARTMATEGHLIRRHAFLEANFGVNRYRLSSPDGMEICGILGIRHNPTCSCISTEIRRSYVEPEGFFACHREIAWHDDENEIHLHPQYCHGTYHITLAVAPDMDACELPDKFYTNFLSTLNMGTKALLLLISGKPWTNLSLGQVYYNEFMNRIRRDTIETSTHKMRGAVKMGFGRVM